MNVLATQILLLPGARAWAPTAVGQGSCPFSALVCSCHQDPLQKCWGFVCCMRKSPLEWNRCGRASKQFQGLMHQCKPVEGGRMPGRPSRSPGRNWRRERKELSAHTAP